MVVFGDGFEPWSVARGGVKRWLHCRSDVTDLTEEQQIELSAWLAAQGIENVPQVLLVTRDGAGNHQLHAAGTTVDVALAELPAWLQRPEPEPVAVPVNKATAGKTRRV